MRRTDATVLAIGHTKTDLIYQIEAIEQGRQYSCWPNDSRKKSWDRKNQSEVRKEGRRGFVICYRCDTLIRPEGGHLCGDCGEDI